MSTIVKYNNTLTSLSDGQTATLKCKDKKMIDDVIIEVVENSITPGFNIAYGYDEPEDTSKLWVKCDQPLQVKITSDIVIGAEELDIGVASLPEPIYEAASAVIGNKIYLFGPSGTTYKDTINVFDTENNTIATLETKLPTAAMGIASAVVGTKIYLFGGQTGISSYLNTINIFDTKNNTITTANSTISPAASVISAAVVGTKIYLFGGYKYFTPNSQAIISVYDTENDTVTILNAVLPSGAHSIASAVVGTKIYLFGGNYYNGSSTKYLNTISVFDTETNMIDTIDVTLPIASYSIASAVVGTKIYLFGGKCSGNTVWSSLDSINVFDTTNNTITTLDTRLPKSTYGIALGVIGNKIYLIGGRGESLNTGYELKTVDIFNVSLPLSTNTLLIETDIGKNLVNVFPSIQIGIKGVYLGNADGYAEKVPTALYTNGAWTEI